jgi:hypothetical protein
MLSYQTRESRDGRMVGEMKRLGLDPDNMTYVQFMATIPAVQRAVARGQRRVDEAPAAQDSRTAALLRRVGIDPTHLTGLQFRATAQAVERGLADGQVRIGVPYPAAAPRTQLADAFLAWQKIHTKTGGSAPGGLKSKDGRTETTDAVADLAHTAVVEGQRARDQHQFHTAVTQKHAAQAAARPAFRIGL